MNTMAGGQANVEQGLQTGLDIVATMVWWDWQSEDTLQSQEQNLVVQGAGQVSTWVMTLFWLTLIPAVLFLLKSSKKPHDK